MFGTYVEMSPGESRTCQNRLLHLVVKCMARLPPWSPCSRTFNSESAWRQGLPLPAWLRTVGSTFCGFCRMYTGITWEEGLGQMCLEYSVNHIPAMKQKFLKIRWKLETGLWPYWFPIRRYTSTLHVMKQMNYFFVSLDSVCFLVRFLPIRVEIQISWRIPSEHNFYRG